MEKFTKFRDPGTGIAPFLPIAPASRTPLLLPLELTLCLFRIPLLFLVLGLEIILVEVVGEITLRRVLPSIIAWPRWLFLRTVLLLCGIWWIDEQLEGVTKSQRKLAVVPKQGNVIASSYTGPLDLIYLAAKYSRGFSSGNGRYDVVFVSCFVSTNRVQKTSFLTALFRSMKEPIIDPPENAKLQTLEELSKSLSNRIIAIFPETTPTNGRGLLTFSPSLPALIPPTLTVYALNIKYTPADITLPTPSPWTLLWRATSFVSHGMRTRITYRPVRTDFHDMMARAGRVKGVGLGPRDKVEFLVAWRKKR